LLPVFPITLDVAEVGATVFRRISDDPNGPRVASSSVPVWADALLTVNVYYIFMLKIQHTDCMLLPAADCMMQCLCQNQLSGNVFDFICRCFI